MTVPLTDEVEAAVARGLWQLPPLPGALSMLTHAADDDQLDAEQIARAVSLDEVLASRVMRAANSAALGFRSPVHSVAQAIARLGCQAVRSMALAQGVAQAMPLPHEVGGIPRLTFWEHNWATAAAAVLLAPTYRVPRDQAHIAGLLHDVGKLVLAFSVPARFEACVAMAQRDQVPLQEVELRCLGHQHPRVGAQTLKSWGLPQSTIQAASQHHGLPPPITLSDIGLLVRAANAVAHACGIGASGDPEPVRLETCLAQDHALSAAVADRCLEALRNQRPAIEELAGLLGHEGVTA